MAKNLIRALFLVMVSASLISLIGCATPKPLAVFKALDLNPKLKTGQYVQKVDTFLVILDASGSMNDPYKGQAKLDTEKNFVHRMNQTIPDMKLTGGLRRFGGTTNPFAKKTALIYGLTDYSKAGLEGGLKTIKWGAGETPLTSGIKAATGDLKSAQGHIAVIIVSDGKGTDGNAVPAAENMKNQYGDRLCIYTVVVGDDPVGQKNMEEIARAGRCGFSIMEESTVSSEDMADFVRKVFLSSVAKPLDSDGDGVTDDRDQCPDTPRGVKVNARGCPLDTDGDGIYDYKDQCPDTPRGVKVNARGCPLDTDGDGVYDYKDQCPNTPRGVRVDASGCPLDTDGDGVYDYKDQCPGTPKGAKVDERGCWVLRGVHFDTDKWDIKPRFYSILDEVVAVLKKNPYLKVEIQGHTDNQGSAAYNQRLSERRAKAVMEYLVRAGIKRYRLTAVGYGLSRPAATNATPEGRAKNRRVELKPIR